MQRELLPVTGVGSLPHLETNEAYQFVWTYGASLPSMVQLPRRGRLAEMLFEPFESAPELIELSGRGSIKKGSLDEALAWSEQCAPVRSTVREFIAQFPAAVAGRVKAQLVGPFTLLTQLHHAGAPLLAQESGRELAEHVLSAHIKAETPLLGEGREELLYVLDEPVLGFLKKKEALQSGEVARSIFSQIRSAGARPGIHCCSALPGRGGAKVLEDLNLDVLSFDFSSLKPVEEIIDLGFVRRHFEKGGMMIWGVIPSVGAGDAEEVGKWWRREMSVLDMPHEVVLRQSALSPACGLGLVSVEKAAEIARAVEAARALILMQA